MLFAFCILSCNYQDSKAVHTVTVLDGCMYLVIGECLPFKLKCTAHHDSWDLIWQAWIAAARHLFGWCISNRQSHYFQSTSSPHLLIVNFRHMTRLLLRLKVFGGGFANIFSCSLFLTSIYLKEARLFISRNIWQIFVTDTWGIHRDPRVVWSIKLRNNHFWWGKSNALFCHTLVSHFKYKVRHISKSTLMRMLGAKNNISLLKCLYERVLWEKVTIVSVMVCLSHLATWTIYSTIINIKNSRVW